ncbi:MAG TPA: prepilin-type N-terminal cleavage/methylation domain-containing protein [Thermoanaerobaculia bacterium]|nr:prepilin-type N-terminal cleavage/methylation domain-containing protein [Thermoanaerobaculia bacterium]
MHRSRGFSLAEVLVALAILAIVITTTIAMFAERAKRMREASETIIAYQALSNEAEYWRRLKFTTIDDPTEQKFQCPDLSVLAPLAPYSTSVKVEAPQADVRNVTLTIRWATNREARLAIARSDTGGTGLW